MIDHPTPTYTVTAECPTCKSGRLVPRRSVTNGGIFLGCSRYPACNHTSAYDEAIQHIAQHLQQLTQRLERLEKRRRGWRMGPVPYLKVVQ